MKRIDNSGKGIAGLGRGEDSMIAHVAPGEMVVPPVLSPETQETIKQEMIAVGLDPNEYTVGQGMSINPITGMAEFGFLKKLGKSLKKVVKKVAPIAAVALPFIPGFQALTPAIKGLISGGISKAGGASTKDALLAGLTVGVGSKFAGKGGVTDAASKIDKSRPLFGKDGRFRDFFIKGSDDSNLADKLFGGMRRNLQPQITASEGEFGTVYTDPQGNEYTTADLQSMGYTFDNAGNIVAPSDTGLFGGQFGPFLRDTFLGTAEDPGLLRNIGSGIGDGGGLGGNAGLMALAALYGKAVKEDFKDKEGGLKDIRQSIRPDLMPAPTFTGFDLGIRKPAAMGGLQELDMRMGGPSIGPGTGTSDDIPAMLSDGEFVMTSAANNGLGGFKVTKTETGIEIMPSGKPNRQKGARNMDRLMKMFEQYNDIGAV